MYSMGETANYYLHFGVNIDQNLTSEIIAALNALQLRPHSLRGQNFLVSEEIIHKIISLYPFDSDMPILEIGAGLASLSDSLANRAGKLDLLEIEPLFAQRLKERFANNMDDDNVYRKLQGHWIIEMSEMMATANAKSIEEIKSFLSRQKEVYKIPYETHPADRPRQCVFGGTSNALDFLPLDRSGNRRFIPVMVYPEQAEVHILEDEAASRAYIEQMWAEAMEIYRSGRFKLAFSPTMQRYLKEHAPRSFTKEDLAGEWEIIRLQEPPLERSLEAGQIAPAAPRQRSARIAP